jgi:putative Holliday junction resolvase
MPATPDPTGSILALDVGDKRVGVARASMIARLPEPLVTLRRGDQFFTELEQIIDQEAVTGIVVGLPRGLNGQITQQTTATESFIADLQRRFDLPTYLQDEALTSKKARAELQSGKSDYKKGDVDALAATYILEDFLADHLSTTEGLV